MAREEQKSRTLLDTDFDSLVAEHLQQHRVPGLSIGIIHNGRIETKGYGFAHLPSTAATPDTLWLAGSLAKSFTAAAIGKVIHDESPSSASRDVKVKWTTPMREIIPDDFVLENEYATAHTTIEDALSHRSGLPTHDMAYGWNSASARDAVRSARHLPMNVQPRTLWQYNNILFSAVELCLQRVTGRTLPEMLVEQIWRPLDMLSTTFSLPAARKEKDSTTGIPRLATGYYWHEDGEYFVPDEYMDLTAVAGAGAIISSVNDLIKWMNALLEVSCPRRKGYTDPSAPQVISRHLFQDMTTPRAIVPYGNTSICDHCSGPTTYGLGWFLHTIGSHRVVTHSGGMVGFGTVLYLLPDHGLGFVTMANTMGSSNTVGQALFLEVLQRLDLYRPDSGQHEIPSMPPTSTVPEEVQMDHQSQTLMQQEPPLERDCNRLAGSIEDYLGKYWHPAYGEFTVKTTDNKELLRCMTRTKEAMGIRADEHDIFLEAEPSARTWPYTYLLKHVEGSTFEMHGFFPHGPSSGETSLNGGHTASGEPANHDSSSGAGSLMNGGSKVQYHTVYQYLYEAGAKFELGDGKDGSTLAKRLGMELSMEMKMSERAEKDASAGMIWLDRA